MLLSSDLTHRVEFSRDEGTTDATNGQHTAAWTTQCVRWATAIESIDGDRFTELRRRFPSARWACAIRYDRTTVTLRALDRLHWTSRDLRYVLQGAPLDADGRRRELLVPLLELFPVQPVTA